ncbi:MAG TPA: HNH endonuclease signature motif containing protein [Chitinophagaceae bacterium]|jgi:hypothetical protein|nr:HNH endonuclease signature motif containing protein [Chitinophagaceae bacterium]HMU58895.1 HNH endonuclease signature motif containing protein [Chitinophagaceae bacterium]
MLASIVLFILAGITLIVTYRRFIRKPNLPHDELRSESRRKEADKPGDNKKSKDDFWRWLFQSPSERRRDYYRNEYLKSDAWKRKRYVVLKRDNWRCVYCGAKATQVHHRRYAKWNIGKEPIEWLVSVCKPCHDKIHS